MNSMVFVNFPVEDVDKSVAFYEKLGFKKNEEFSTDEASAVVWDDTFWIMLLSHGFYKKFLKDKEIADNKKTSLDENVNFLKPSIRKTDGRLF